MHKAVPTVLPGATFHHTGEMPTEDTFGTSPLGLSPQMFSDQVLKARYLQPGERGVSDLFDRVAHALAKAETPALHGLWEERFRRNLDAGGLVADRIMASAGTGLHTSLVDCFVQPVGDCVIGRDEAGQPGIYEALGQAAETLRRGGSVGYDFSALRPRGALVRSTACVASGPCSYMGLFDQSCASMVSMKKHCGAQMGVLRIDHPDILEFIAARNTSERWPHFKLTVAVSNAFMQALDHKQDWCLLHRATPAQMLIDQGAHWRDDGLWVYRKLPAQALWEQLMRAIHARGGPGVLFTDTIARDNNLGSVETIQAVTPCGAQPLPAYGCCVLGSVVLTHFVRHPFGHGGNPALDFEGIAACTRVLVRGLDNVIDITHWPLLEQQREAMAKRRLGIGLTGMADALIMLGLRYDSQAARDLAARIGACLRDAAYATSVELAREKGPYPLFNADSCLTPGVFASRLPEALKNAIRQHGLRNSHLLSIDSAHPVSLALADNASPGIEPATIWHAHDSPAPLEPLDTHLENHALRVFQAIGGDARHLPESFVSASQIHPSDHLAMVAVMQPFVDAAISHTIKLPAHADWQEIQALCIHAWRSGLKGLTVYRLHPHAHRPARSDKSAATTSITQTRA